MVFMKSVLLDIDSQIISFRSRSSHDYGLLVLLIFVDISDLNVKFFFNPFLILVSSLTHPNAAPDTTETAYKYHYQ